MTRRPGARQLALLRSMQHGDVGGDVDTDEIWWVGYRVTPQVQAMEKAGWCTPVATPDRIEWVPTEAGRAEVEAADSPPVTIKPKGR